MREKRGKKNGTVWLMEVEEVTQSRAYNIVFVCENKLNFLIILLDLLQLVSVPTSFRIFVVFLWVQMILLPLPSVLAISPWAASGEKSCYDINYLRIDVTINVNFPSLGDDIPQLVFSWLPGFLYRHNEEQVTVVMR